MHKDNGMLLGHIRKEILPFVTMWVDPEGITVSEVRERHKVSVIVNIKIEQTQQSRNRLIGTESKLLVTKGEEFGGLGKRGEGD